MAGRAVYTAAIVAVLMLFGAPAAAPAAQRPPAPTNLTVKGTTTSSVSLAWSASTSKSKVLRDGVVAVTTSSTAATVSNLPCGTTSTYTVVAVRNGVSSLPSTPVDATTGPCPAPAPAPGPTPAPTPAPNQAPTAPTGLRAAPGDGTVSLSWSPSTDDARVAGYRVLRGSAVIATTTSTSFADTGLSNGTSYAYSVVAFDDEAAESAPSAVVNATPTSSSSVVRYVATTGSDSNDGSAAKPWRTIQKAAGAAPLGAVVQVAPGTYGENVSVARSGLEFRSTTPGQAKLKSFSISAGQVTVD